MAAAGMLASFGCSEAAPDPSGGGGGGGGPAAICSEEDPFDLAQCPAAYPAWRCTVYVDGDVATSGDGWSWQSAVKTVQEGIDRAHCGAVQHGVCEQWQVWVKKGRYHVHQGCRSDIVRLRPQVAVHGGFAGGEETLEQRDGTGESILDGASANDPEAQVYHVVEGADEAVLEGVTIRGGRADHPTQDVHKRGGGMLNLASATWVEKVVFRDNYAAFNGGAMYNQNSAPTVIGCHFENNQSGYFGGAISNNLDADAVILDSTFVDNWAVDAGAVNNYQNRATIQGCRFEGNAAELGGAVLAHGADNLIEGSAFLHNHAIFAGGAVMNRSGGTITLLDCDLESNIAEQGGAYYSTNGSTIIAGGRFVDNAAAFAGAIAIDNGEAAISATTLELNTASVYGGALLAYFGSVELTDSEVVSNRAWAGGGIALRGNASELTARRTRLVDNEAEYWGGAIDSSWGAQAQLESCLLVGNTAVRGAAIEAGGSGYLPAAGALSILHSTVTDNQAASGGGAVDRAGELTVRGCILWGNGPEEIAGSGAILLSIADSDVSGGGSGGGNLALDPGFVDVTLGDYRLAAGSPCIDAADGALAPATDLAGNPRVDDPSAPDAAGCTPPCADMGAYERQP